MIHLSGRQIGRIRTQESQKKVNKEDKTDSLCFEELGDFLMKDLRFLL
jgi:hypothetical protein